MSARLLHWAGLLIGLAAILLQLALSVPAFMADGMSFGGAVVKFFSFFTILTNAAAVLVHAASLRETSGKPHFFARPAVRAGVLVSMAVVTIIYGTVLASLWRPAGWFLVCDVLLHYVAPAILLFWWVGFGADGSTRWRHVPWWLAYPIAYVAYVLVRAPIAGEIPYPFLDIEANGVGSVALSIAGITVLYLALAAAAVGFDRFVSARGRDA